MVLEVINKVLFKTVVFLEGSTAMEDKKFWLLPLLLISSSSKTLWRNTEVMTRKIFIPLAALVVGEEGTLQEEDRIVSNGRSFVRQTCKADMSGCCRNLSTMFVWQMFSVTSAHFMSSLKKLIEYLTNWFIKHIIWWKMTIYWLMVGLF